MRGRLAGTIGWLVRMSVPPRVNLAALGVAEVARATEL